MKELLELRRRAEAPATPPTSTYTPPVAQLLGWDEADEGSLSKGVFAGSFCGRWALLALAFLSSRELGSETKRGIYIGLLINLVCSLSCAMIRMLTAG